MRTAIGVITLLLLSNGALSAERKYPAMWARHAGGPQFPQRDLRALFIGGIPGRSPVGFYTARAKGQAIQISRIGSTLSIEVERDAEGRRRYYGKTDMTLPDGRAKAIKAVIDGKPLSIEFGARGSVSISGEGVPEMKFTGGRFSAP